MRKYKVTAIYTKKDGTIGVKGRLETREEVRIRFLKETWQKLKKYRMKSTGVSKTDDEIKKLFGEWL